jgi:pimeloyl-ACP methyl ester carboxylesterase
VITPFVINVPQARLDAIRRRVEMFDWDGLADAGAWRSGVGLADLRRLVTHWLGRFDWRAQESRLNQWPQFTTEILGQRLHYIHVRAAAGARRPPLLLIHGWPGSFLEFEQLIAPLAADGHDVVVPSLPGYGFSGRPESPIGPRRTGALFHGLMTALFGDQRYGVQGGDWGSGVGAWLAHDFPQACVGLHLNMVMIQARDVQPQTAQELDWAARRDKASAQEMGYAIEHATRPQTLNVGLSDSPVGVAAWILEKFGAWSAAPRDAEGRPDLWQAFDEDLLLTNIMLYLVSNAIVTSTWFYRGNILEGSRWFAPGARVATPTAVAAFPDPVFLPPPRSLAEKSYNIVQWTEVSAGGHFAALEQPQLLLGDVRRFFAARDAG